MPLANGYANIGDYVQTIAVRHALKSIFDCLDFDWWDRDSLSFYDPLDKDCIRTCVMQAWLSHTETFFPNERINPVWLSSHFSKDTKTFIQKVLCVRRSEKLFKFGVGCRDLSTLEFCRKQNIESYLSRCLTLTLPRRENLDSQNEIIFVDVPEKFDQYLPKDWVCSAIRMSQRWIDCDHEHWSKSYNRAKEFLDVYSNRAKIVVTTGLHIASPCLAMGIPVILIASDPDENLQRFSALDGLIRPYTYSDFEKGLVNFNPVSYDIEDLKGLLLKNLELSIRQSWGENVSLEVLEQIRKGIRDYKLI